MEAAACLSGGSAPADLMGAGSLLAEAPLAALAPGGMLHAQAAGARVVHLRLYTATPAICRCHCYSSIPAIIAAVCRCFWPQFMPYKQSGWCTPQE